LTSGANYGIRNCSFDKLRLARENILDCTARRREALNKRNWIFWIGIGLIVLGSFGLAIPPENTPAGWQEYWFKTPDVRTIGNSDEQSHPGAVASIYKGHRSWKGKVPIDEGTLDFAKVATRNEAALADARVDARAQYRAHMAVIALIGVLMALLACCWKRRCECNDKVEKVYSKPITETASTPVYPIVYPAGTLVGPVDEIINTGATKTNSRPVWAHLVQPVEESPAFVGGTAQPKGTFHETDVTTVSPPVKTVNLPAEPQPVPAPFKEVVEEAGDYLVFTVRNDRNEVALNGNHSLLARTSRVEVDVDGEGFSGKIQFYPPK
jgi:hypothetical protein